MKYYYCLTDKSDLLKITENVYECEVVLTDSHDKSRFLYKPFIDAPETSNEHGVPHRWVLDFTESLENPTPRLKNKTDLMPEARINKMNEIKQDWLNSMIKGNPLCYVITSVNDIVMDASRDDLQNMQTVESVMKKTEMQNIMIKDYYDQTHNVSYEEIQTIVLNLESRGIELFALKEQLYYQISIASSLDELNKIQWPMRKKYK